MTWVEERNGYLYLHIHTQPRASRNEVVGIQGDSLKIRLTSPPVEGAANALLVEFVAKRLGLSKSKVEIVSGEKSRKKVLKVEGITKTEAVSILGTTP